MQRATKILICDDGSLPAAEFEHHAVREGYELRYLNELVDLNDGTEDLPDIVVLGDLRPENQMLKVIAQTTDANIPVIRVSHRDDSIDRILSLELGADDYIVLPFAARELFARVKAVLRRQQRSIAPVLKKSRDDNLRIDHSSMSATIDEQYLPLTAVEFQLLSMLAATPGEVVTKDQIFDQVFHRQASPYERTLDTHISNLRKKIRRSEAVEFPNRIRTIRGKGYLYCLPPRVAISASSQA